MNPFTVVFSVSFHISFLELLQKSPFLFLFSAHLRSLETWALLSYHQTQPPLVEWHPSQKPPHFLHLSVPMLARPKSRSIRWEGALAILSRIFANEGAFVRNKKTIHSLKCQHLGTKTRNTRCVGALKKHKNEASCLKSRGPKSLGFLLHH